jgi:hypothetical protein
VSARSITAATLLGLLILTSVVAGASRLLGVARLGGDMARLPTFEQRRLTLFGPPYAGVRQLRAAMPANATIDFVMLVPEARDIAVLGGADLQPRDVRFFDGWDAWKLRKRAEFLHDARAANAPPGPPPPPAQFVVAVDPRKKLPFRIVNPAP